MNEFLVYLFGSNNVNFLGAFCIRRRKRYYAKHTYITANYELVMRSHSVKRSDNLIPTSPSTSKNWKRTMTNDNRYYQRDCDYKVISLILMRQDFCHYFLLCCSYTSSSIGLSFNLLLYFVKSNKPIVSY